MRHERNKQALSEINVTPFVDVMLVLLIIFMATVPLMKQGIDVELPATKGLILNEKSKRYTITIKKSGTIYLNDLKLSQAKLVKKLRAISKINPDIFLKADKRVPYGRVVEIIAEIKSAGIQKLGIITLPESTRKRLKKRRN